MGEGKWDIVFNLKGKKSFQELSGKRCEGSGCERWNKGRDKGYLVLVC